MDMMGTAGSGFLRAIGMLDKSRITVEICRNRILSRIGKVLVVGLATVNPKWNLQAVDLAVIGES